MKSNMVILVLIDGLGSIYFQENRARLPYLDALADRGRLSTGVRPAVPGTSRPGRANLLTGRGPRDHGIYGNAILDGTAFRPAAATDIRVPTIARRARAAGRSVAGLGFGMLDPADTCVHAAPWWLHVPKGGMTTLKTPAAADGTPDLVLHDPEGRIAEVVPPIPFTLSAQTTDALRLHAHLIGLAGDHRMLGLAADLACGPRPPDLIVTEFDMTDLIAHRHGLDSAVTSWVFAEADMAVGLLVHRLSRAGRLDDCLLIVCGDHGHAAIGTAHYPANIMADRRWASEGATVHVVVEDPARHADLAARLAADFGIRQLDTDHLPEAMQGRLATFVAPAGAAFEPSPPEVAGGPMSGMPTVISTHGLDPRDPADRTIVIAHGPAADTMPVERLEDIAPLLLRGLGMQDDG